MAVLWVMTTVVAPTSSLPRAMAERTSFPVSTSSPPVGSSQRRASGRFTMARATATRCCSPVCRMHGARGGAPTGKANGNYRTGEYTAEVLETKRLIRALTRQVKKLAALA